MVGKFIGKNSMGFKSGHVYDIKSDIRMIDAYGEKIPYICIYDVHGLAWCPYRSLKSVLDNWEIKP